MPITLLGIVVGLAAVCPALFVPSISSLETILIYLIVSMTAILMQAAIIAWPSRKLPVEDR